MLRFLLHHRQNETSLSLIRPVPCCPILLWSFLLPSPSAQLHVAATLHRCSLSVLCCLLLTFFCICCSLSQNSLPSSYFWKCLFHLQLLVYVLLSLGSMSWLPQAEKDTLALRSLSVPSPLVCPFYLPMPSNSFFPKLFHVPCLRLYYEWPICWKTSPMGLHLINSFLSFMLSLGAICSRKPSLSHQAGLSAHFYYPKALNLHTSNYIKCLISMSSSLAKLQASQRQGTYL